MIRLFKAYSIYDNFDGHDQVTVSWFCRGRGRPLGSYEKLIEDYLSMLPEHRDMARACVRQFLTMEELEEFRQFLLARRIGLIEEEVPLPVHRDQWDRVSRRGYWFDNSRKGVVSWLIYPEGQALSMRMGYYYDVRTCPPSIELSKPGLYYGKNSASKVLSKLGISPPDDDIKQAVKNLYDREGLYLEHTCCWDEESYARKLLKQLDVSPSLDQITALANMFDDESIKVVHGNNRIQRLEEKEKLWPNASGGGR